MLRLRIASPRHARVLFVEVPDHEILDGWVDDHKLGPAAESRWNKNGTWGFAYANAGAGMELKLQAKGVGPLRLVVVERSIGLPETPGQVFAPRPADSMPQGSGDQTLVRHSFVF
jgi:hypothetical protein